MAEPPIQLADLDRPPTAAWREPRPRSSRSSAESHLELEALELHEIQTREDDELDYSTASASSGDDAPRRTIRRTISRPSDRPSRQGLWGQLTRFWGRHVTLTVPQKTNRDHYGKNLSILHSFDDMSRLLLSRCSLLRSLPRSMPRRSRCAAK